MVDLCAVCQAPPRPADDSVQQVEMSGYSAARSDFSVEHNNFAELDIRDVTVTDNDGSLDAGTLSSLLLCFMLLLLLYML